LMSTHNSLLDSVQCKVISIGQEDPLKAFGFSPFLEENWIHIWSARYGDLEQHFKVLSKVIRFEEQRTASAFRKSADTRKYVLRQGLLRIILGNYTHHNPEMVSFTTGLNGKPELDSERAYADVSFNLSHSSEMVLIGVTKKRRIGVDIVKMDPLYRFHESAEYILTPAEKAFLKSIEPAQRYQVFFRMWALKEAILKATGSTLSMMEKTDLSAIIQDILGSKDYSMKYLNMHPPFFIWQFTSGSEHLGAIAADVSNSS